jgi:acyl-CoA reductase-like NAD-dependent aldehyde dehydrogenase
MKFAGELKKIESKHFINGSYVASKGQETYQVVNPATEELIGLEAKGNI